jgi:NADH:ubiquinone oxidoreductase subunit H
MLLNFLKKQITLEMLFELKMCTKYQQRIPTLHLFSPLFLGGGEGRRGEAMVFSQFLNWAKGGQWGLSQEDLAKFGYQLGVKANIYIYIYIILHIFGLNARNQYRNLVVFQNKKLLKFGD